MKEMVQVHKSVSNLYTMLFKHSSLIHWGWLLLSVFSVCVHPSSNTVVQDGSVPLFSSKYTASGVLNIPYAEIKEPFNAWYDSESSSSRIDYYGDMVQTYQLGSFREFGAMREVVPITTETEVNVHTCIEVNGTKDFPVSPQSILPDLTGFKNIGPEVMNGKACEKWRLIETFEEKVNTYTMWILYENSTNGPEPVPVRYDMKGYNSLLGSHYDHYYLDYDKFSSGSPDPDVFQVDGNLTCQDFPDPDDEHVYTFNPMKEFVHNYDSHVKDSFDKFKHTHNKQYKDDKENNHRLNVYRQNMRFITSKNRAHLGFQLGVNHLADWTDNELKALRGRRYSGDNNGGLPFPEVSEAEMRDIPSTLDWRLYGAVTPVKDQVVCGSCWSFGTTGTIEGSYFLKYGKLERLSQQALIDCSWGFGNDGCDGGLDYLAYRWIMKYGGLPTEAEYGPYLGQDGYCHVNSTNLIAQITGYTNVTSWNADILKYAVATQGPISVAIDASHKTFSFYSNGVYYDPECGNKLEQLDHAVLVVGYGEMNGSPYWLVKNSWSTYWGDDGYVLMAQKDNNCGVDTIPTYVHMK